MPAFANAGLRFGNTVTSHAALISRSLWSPTRRGVRPYVTLIQRLIAENDLDELDTARLDPTPFVGS